MKMLRYIKVDSDKCSGCRSCEIVCSAFHADPRYSLTNPKRSRIRVFWDEANDLFVPILAGQYTDAECNGRHVTVIAGKEYGECSFCRAACPSRDHRPKVPPASGCVCTMHSSMWKRMS
jgi:benzoyl-CoA reductase subunit BamC